MTEAQLHRAVADFLNVALIPPTWWTTFPLGGGGYVRGAQLRARGAKKGTPDILVVRDGRALWIELKSAKGRISDEQWRIKDALLAAGCGWCVCRSLAEVAKALREWGVPVRARAA